MTLVKVVGIVGSQGNLITDLKQSGSGVGKDTLADIFTTQLDYLHVKFANSLRDMFYSDFGLPIDKKRNKNFEFNNPDKFYSLQESSPRYDLLNSEFFIGLDRNQIINYSLIEYAAVLRDEDPNVFVLETLRKIIDIVKNSNKPEVNIVISDVRQFNEFLLLKAMSGTLLEIWRTNALRERQSLDCQLLTFSDYKIHNNRSIESLTNKITSKEFWEKENSFTYTSSETLEYLLKGYLNEPPFNSQL